MKKSLLFIVVSVCFSLFVSAGNGIKIIASDAQSVTLELTFDPVQKQAHSINGQTYYKIYANKCVPVLEAGFPQVLRQAVSIAIPDAFKPRIEIINSQFEEVANTPIAPSKGSLMRNVNPETVPYVFGSAYSKNEWYPAQVSEVSTLYQLRSQNGAAISFYPVQVNPVSNLMRVYSKMIVKFTYLNKAGRAMRLNTPLVYSNEEQSLFEHRFVNVNFEKASNAKVLYTPLSEFGNLLVITAPQFISTIQPLVNWKNQKGIRTQLVSTALTGSTQASIKSYIQNYYATNPSLMYVLLVGDHEQVSSFNAGNSGSEIKWSDSKYGMITGNDWYPELMVGRFSSTNGQEIGVMVTRTLEYEKNPSIGNWWGKGVGIGSNEGYGIGDDNEPDWMHIRNIGNKLLTGAGYNQYHEFYDSSHGGNDAPGNPTSAMVINAVNGGAGIFLYSGHGSQGSCATSSYDINDILAGTNYGKYPFSLQVACNNGTFIGGTCFSEVFLRASGPANLGPKGGIASCGSSILMAWAEPMQTQDEIGDIISNQYPNLKCYTLGGLFYNGQMSMLDKYPTNTGKGVMDTWVMFGDPTCLFRSATPTNISATHATCINPGAVNFVVTTNSGPGKNVSVSQGNVVLGTAAVLSNQANVVFTQALNPNQNIDVVVTEYNKIPYIQSLPVCITTGLNTVAANTAIQMDGVCQSQLTIRFNAFQASDEAQVMIYDLQGRLVQTSSVAASDTQSISTVNLSPSVYIVKVSVNQHVLKVGKVVKE